MAGTLYTSSELDRDGRQILTSDIIRDVFYYSAVGETWDRVGAAGQSWYSELFLPNDSFDASVVDTTRWGIVDTAVASTSTIEPVGGLLQVGVEGDDGRVGLSSEGKWRLSGDFDIRLYIDWDSYYNEYRSIAHTFLKVGVDASNAVRVAFSFDGVDGYQYSSEKAVNRNLVFFDWLDNGAPIEAGTIASASAVLFLKVTRVSGVIRTYVSTGTTDTLVGDPVSDAVFSEDMYVEFGVEAKEFNTYRSAFRKFFVFGGDITPPDKFSSSLRGETQDFPEKTVLAVEDNALSIIDEAQGTLWMRIPFGAESPIPDSTSKVSACNGTVYLTTVNGIVAFDFHRDSIFRYRGSDIQIADEPIALRNSEITFRTFAADIGDIPNNSFNDIACLRIGNDDYVAATSAEGITVFRALSSGIAYSEDGPLPGAKVGISDKGSLYWVGYDLTNNDGELSYFSNITALAGTGTTQFNRTGYYGTETPLSLFGNNITSFDVRTVAGVDLLAVGSTEGISFLSFSPGGPFTKSLSYGVEAPAANPFTDPSFENYLGISWTPFFFGSFLKKFLIGLDDWSSHPEGVSSLKFRLPDGGVGTHWTEDTQLGVYQLVDLTGVSTIYFDALAGTPAGSAGANVWDFEVVVGTSVVKSIRDIDGPFTRFNDSADVRDFTGVQKVSFRIRVLRDGDATDLDTKYIQIDNLRTKAADPDFRVLPPGNAAIQEVLLQYDSQGHKIYFSTQLGYGAVDLDDNSLDYFIPTQTFVDGAENVSADFSRIENEV